MFETTEDSWHGVQSISFPKEITPLSRKSVTIYFYTKDRPVELTAPRHSTIYYPGEISDNIKVGRVLTEQDVFELKNFQNRSNTLIHNLYKEHSRLYERISKFKKNNGLLKRTNEKLRLRSKGDGLIKKIFGS